MNTPLTPLTPAPISPVQEIVAEMRAGRMVILWMKKTAKTKATWFWPPST